MAVHKDRSGILLVFAGVLLICGNPPKAGGPGAAAQGGRTHQAEEISRMGENSVSDNAGITGSLRLAGSSSMERYVDALAEGFMKQYPGADVTVQFTGSSAGIAAVARGMAEIGISSRYLTEAEKAADVTETLMGLEGIAVCGNSANGVDAITGEELTKIYTGEITSWSQLSGSGLPVVTIGREAGSGTRSAFEGWLGLEDRCFYSNELDSTGAVMARIAATPGAVGYVSWEAAERMGKQAGRNECEKGPPVRILKLDGREPSPEAVKTGDYPLYRPFMMVTKGKEAMQNQLICAWFAYVYSDKGRAIAEQMGIAVP